MVRCLTVDDDSEIRHALSDYLQRFGMTVSPAANDAEVRRSSQKGDLGANAAKRRTVQFERWRFDEITSKGA